MRQIGEIEGLYPCPACGYMTFRDPPGSYEFCRVCGWQDDVSQLRFPSVGGGANLPSLIEAQQNFERFGASAPDLAGVVCGPQASDIKDHNWQPLLLRYADVHEANTATMENDDYPLDLTKLYYWRR